MYYTSHHIVPEKSKFEPLIARLRVGEANTRGEGRHQPEISTKTSFLVSDNHIMILTSNILKLKNTLARN